MQASEDGEHLFWGLKLIRISKAGRLTAASINAHSVKGNLSYSGRKLVAPRIPGNFCSSLNAWWARASLES